MYKQVRANPKTLFEWVRLFKTIRKPEDHPEEKVAIDLVRAVGTRTTDEKFATSVLEIVQRTPVVEAEIARQHEFLSQVDGAREIA